MTRTERFLEELKAALTAERPTAAPAAHAGTPPPTAPHSAAPDELRGDAKRQQQGETLTAALDAIHGHRAERVLVENMRGEMAFARGIASAPSLMAQFERLKREGRLT